MTEELNDTDPLLRSRREASLSRLEWMAAIALIAILLVRVVSISWDKSACNDEPKHLLTGVGFLENGWCCLGSNNTALAALWGLPEYVLGAPRESLGATATHWRYFRARLMNLPLVVLLAAYVLLWSRKLFGTRMGLVSLFLLCLSPNVSAHAALVSPDFHVTALMLPATYHLRGLLLDGFGIGRTAIAALFFYLAQIAKYTGLILVPSFLGAAALLRGDILSRVRRLGLATVVMAAGFLLVALTYELPGLISGRSVSDVVERGLGTHGLERDMLRTPATPEKLKIGLASGRIPVGYLNGLANAKKSVEEGYGCYLNGTSGPPRLAYYPEAFLIKTPLATLALVVLGILGLLAAWRRRWPDLLLLLLPVVLLWAAAMSLAIQLGLRHLLPIYPFLFVTAGAARLGGTFRRRCVLGLLLAWQAWAGLHDHPHELSYFNEIVGGPSRGHLYLAYENLDWGQDLRRLAAFQREHHTGSVPFRYFGSINPAAYGVQSRYMPENTPMSGWIAVSRSYQTTRKGLAWLDAFQPVKILGHSILVYHITEEQLKARGLADGPRTEGDSKPR